MIFEKPDLLRLFSMKGECTMDSRLRIIEQKIPDGIGVIDVGTDHGTVPVWLVQRGYPGHIFASDINVGPLNAAKHTAAQAGVTDWIEFLLSDGLQLCPPEAVDTIVIAGMGGDLIVKILDEAEWCMHPRYRLILQPMTRAEVLRYWLAYNEFEILSESVAEEGNTLYQILTARFGGHTALNDAELFCGKRSLAEDDRLWLRSLNGQTQRLEKALRGMENGAGDAARASLYREILVQMREMGESV